MTASVVFVYATRDDALRIPNAALRFKPDAATVAAMGASAPKQLAPEQRLVWVVDGKRARPELVRVGIGDNTTAELLDGAVHAGDRVVVEATTGKAQ